jgi:hypothetical protein
MGTRLRDPFGIALVAATLLFLASCAPAAELDLEQVESPEETAAPVEQVPESVTYVPPEDCQSLLPRDMQQDLMAQGISLLRGPGSPSEEPIYVDGESPEETVGGLSCFFGIAGDEESVLSIVLSAAPVDPAMRPDIIADLLAQNLNVGQTTDGTGLTYWIWGDEAIVSALHNELFEDAWYSALIQPGGRPAYDQAVELVAGMRQVTTQ